MSSGNIHKYVAESAAEDWSKFTGWPVIDMGRVPEFDDKERKDWQ